MTTREPVECRLTEMDGVLVREEHAIPGAADFLPRLPQTGRGFQVLTNTSIDTPRARLEGPGIDIPEEATWTSALVTAQFLNEQRQGGSAYVLGEVGLTTALHDVSYVLSARGPDDVMLGETQR